MSDASASFFQKRHELEERTLKFARDVRIFVRKLSKEAVFSEDASQLITVSGAMGAHYIEANEASPKRDFRAFVRLCVKDAKECTFWLRLVEVGESPRLQEERKRLSDEATQLLRIFCTILGKTNALTKKKKDAPELVAA